MTDHSSTASEGGAGRQPPQTFLETVDMPLTASRTAIAIKNARMTATTLTFTLQGRKGNEATYSAVCPRCGTGEIVAFARLNPDGSFAEHPACPSLCLACEDRLDAILEPEPSLKDEPANRDTLGKYLRAMEKGWK